MSVAARPEIGAVDAVMGLHTPEVMRARPDWTRGLFEGKFHASPDIVEGLSLDGYREMMEDAAIEHGLLFAQKAGPSWHPASHRLDPRRVIDAVEAHPDRFSGLIGVDPTQGMAGVRELERAIVEYGFVGAHAYPHWFELSPDHRLWYPLYAKCCELDVPIQLQVGHCLVYSEQRPLRSVGHPMTLDTVACDFPELKLVGIHIGWPWTEEMISVAYKHENVYIGSDAYAPAHWDEAFVRFIDSWGSSKVLFGTDFPVIHPARARDEIAQLEIRDASLRRFLRDNAIALYGLETRVGADA